MGILRPDPKTLPDCEWHLGVKGVGGVRAA